MNLEEIMDPSNLYVSENVTLQEWMDATEARLRRQWDRRFIGGTPFADYLDFERYCLDVAELGIYENRENLHPCTLDRIKELEERIAAYEHEHNIIYGDD